MRAVLTAAGSSAPIEIDGGIDLANVADVVAAGATILVAGKAIFGTSDPEAATRALRAAANGASDARRVVMTTRTRAGAIRSSRVRVRYAETDQMGVVYYANYLVWFEVGRTEWLRDGRLELPRDGADGVSLPVIEAHCEYRQPARYDDEIEIRTEATRADAGADPVRLRSAASADETLLGDRPHRPRRARARRPAVPAARPGARDPWIMPCRRTAA